MLQCHIEHILTKNVKEDLHSEEMPANIAHAKSCTKYGTKEMTCDVIEMANSTRYNTSIEISMSLLHTNP